jgi:lysozyme family protein
MPALIAAEMIDEVIHREGGFVDHPDDRGGPTNFGITLATLAAWRGAAVTRADVEALTKDEARKIYERDYVEKPGFAKIADERLRGQLVDAGVLSGPKAAIKMLQRALKVDDDGVLGAITLATIANVPADALRRRMAVERIRFLGRLVTDKPNQAVFCAGWMNRATEFLLD